MHSLARRSMRNLAPIENKLARTRVWAIEQLWKTRELRVQATPEDVKICRRMVDRFFAVHWAGAPAGRKEQLVQASCAWANSLNA